MEIIYDFGGEKEMFKKVGAGGVRDKGKEEILFLRVQDNYIH